MGRRCERGPCRKPLPVSLSGRGFLHSIVKRAVLPGKWFLQKENRESYCGHDLSCITQQGCCMKLRCVT